MYLFSVLLLGAVAFHEPNWNEKFPRINDRPVMGVLTHSSSAGREYFSSDYVKFLRSAGARVVPLRYTLSSEALRQEMAKLNGVLVTGGGDVLSIGDELTPFTKSVKVVLDFSKEEMENGRYFPVWGTCMGLEAFFIALSETRALGYSDANDVLMPLHFQRNPKHTNMFREFPDYLLKNLAKNPLTYHAHDRGVPLDFYNDKELNLKSIFNVLATSRDPSGQEIVVAVSHTSLPIYAVMFHPEKALFDFDPAKKIPHEPDAIELGVNLANFLVFESRRSPLRYDYAELVHAEI